MKFLYRLLSQSQLGELFGVSSHKIGDWLVQCGLRNEQSKKPTPKAHQEQYCDTAPSRNGQYCWAWNAEKTVAALVDAGHRLVPNPPQELIEPAQLHGPFSIQKVADGTAAVVNGNGSS